jgi:L-malate glycosyltransferase
MKMLMFAHKLDFGGSQVNAIELAAALRDLHGIDVVIFATPGPMVELVKEKGLRFLAAPDPRGHPSPARTRALRDAVRRERPDVLHVWDWWQCLDAYYSVHLPMRIPMVVTDMTMRVTRILPKELVTTFGTPELVNQAKASGRRRVELLLPPVDVHLNAPAAVDSRPFRDRYDIKDGDITLVTVSRLDVLMKSESLLRTVACVRALGHDLPLRFVIAGDGTARSKLDRLADEVNAELGRPAVVLTGALLDPRPAYAAADIVVGMGGSALRGMAFGKPVIVVGEQGFSAPFTPETAESFYQRGFYGLGDSGSSNAHLVAQILALAEHPDQRLAIGQFSRHFVLRHFSLETVSARFAALCQTAAAETPPLYTSITGGFRTTAVYLRERTFLWRWAPPKLTVESRGQ